MVDIPIFFSYYDGIPALVDMRGDELEIMRSSILSVTAKSNLIR